MGESLQLKGITTTARNYGPYIFFTGTGLGWMGCALILFITALARSSGYLLLFSLLLIALTVLIIFLTHENIGGLAIEGLFQEVDLISGGHHVVVTVKNSSSSTRYHVRINIALDKKAAEIRAADILAMSPGETHKARIALPWTESGNGSPSIRRVTLQSRFPCGLVRSWKSPRRREKRWYLDLVPVPRPFPTDPDDRLASSKLHLDQPAAMIRPYSNENPARIAWLPSLRTGELLVREKETYNQNTQGQQNLTWFPEREGEAGRIYAASLINFRQRLPFSVLRPDGRPVFSWPRSGVPAETALQSLLELLNRGPPADPSPAQDRRTP